MPPQVPSSDYESDDDIIVPKKGNATSADPIDGQSEDEAEEDANDTDTNNEFAVEAIMDHKFGGDDGNKLLYLVKWQDYPKKKDWTWEPEEHLEGSGEILQDYLKQVGGRPVQKTPPRSAAKKRGRTSIAASTTPAKSAKKPRTSIAAQSQTPVADDDDKKWKPPAGLWEDQISNIDTIEKTDSGLVCYVQWANGRKSQHDIGTVYKKCPQRMLTFYEQHLVFKESGTL